MVTCFSCRTNVIKKTEEEKRNEFEELPVKVGYRKYFATRGKRSTDGNARKNAINQLKSAQEKGYQSIQEYFKKDEKCRTQNTKEGYDENSIKKVDELAAIPARRADVVRRSLG